VTALFVRLFRALPPGAAHAFERLARTAPFRHGPLRKLVVAGQEALLSGEVTILHGPAAGLRFVAEEGKVGFTLGSEEPELQAELARLLTPGDVFYDVGANVGFMTLVGAALVGRTGRVIAFEPIPRLAAAVRANAERNGLAQIEVHELALADEEATARFVVPEESSGAHLADVNAGDGETFDVQVTTLDAFLARTGAPPPTAIKLDIEGAELRALDGMRRTLATHGPALVVELHGTREPFERLLRELGYEATGDVHDAARPEGNDHVFAKPLVGPDAAPPGTTPVMAPDAPQ
jgi:FkbM family methyltransferase